MFHMVLHVVDFSEEPHEKLYEKLYLNSELTIISLFNSFPLQQKKKGKKKCLNILEYFFSCRISLLMTS